MCLALLSTCELLSIGRCPCVAFFLNFSSKVIVYQHNQFDGLQDVYHHKCFLSISMYQQSFD
jgi:hypothetical protein